MKTIKSGIKYHIAVCAIVAEWDKPYISEWVTYYHRLGVERIVLYLNNWSDPSIEVDDPTGVVLVRWDGDAAQISAYNSIARYQLDGIDWAWFLDADEYLTVMDNEHTLDEILSQYDDEPNLGVNWRLFSSGGLQRCNGDYRVQERFHTCHSRCDSYCKIAVNLNWFRKNLFPINFLNPHFNQIYSVNLNGTRYEGMWSFEKNDEVHALEVWHYAVKSLEECEYRRSQKRADNGLVREGVERKEFFKKYEDDVNRNAVDCRELKYHA